MAKDTYYFSHDYHARNDRKIAALVKDYKSSGYGIFWATCELMHEEGGVLEFDNVTIHAIAKDLNENEALINEVLDKCVIKYRLFTKQNEAPLEANEAPLEAKILLHSGRIKRNLEDRNDKQKNKAESGRLGGIKSGESRRNKENDEAKRSTASSNEAKERKGKENNSSSNGHPAIGSEVVVAAAKVAWEDKKWKEQTCMAHYLSEDDLRLWMAQYNASICNDFIPDFNDGKYRKLFGGWMNSQREKGRSLPKKPITGREQFTTLKP